MSVATIHSFCVSQQAHLTTNAEVQQRQRYPSTGDGMNCVLNGILRACGRQALGARLHLTAYWLCGERGGPWGGRLCNMPCPRRMARLSCTG